MVGLGNPGPEYAQTLHNAGFGVLAVLAARRGARWSRPLGLRGEVARCRLGADVTLLRPLTYMNASGEAVRPLVRKLRLTSADVVLVYDDLDLPAGHLRVRAGGGSGGHRGVASVIASLGTESFPRVRIGIGRPPAGWDAADYVLNRLPADQLPSWEAALCRAADAVEFLCARGLEPAMQKFHGAPAVVDGQ